MKEVYFESYGLENLYSLRQNIRTSEHSRALRIKARTIQKMPQELSLCQ